MDSSQTGWWRRHGWTVALLLAAFGISFAIRTVWSYPIIAQWGALNVYAGGSDSYYHSRVMAYIALNHHNLITDPLLNFPRGLINPREPLFDWMNGVLGVAFAPLFGGNPVTAGAWFLDLQAPLWSALGVFPVYLIGREVSGRRVGLVAALIYPFLSANIDSSIFGYANYLSFYTFFILLLVYAYLRTVKSVGNRRWVENYRSPRSVLAGLRGFLRTERTAVKWAVFTGVSLGALALAWQGFTYGIVVIGISILITTVIERIRRVDSFGLYVATWIVGLVGFPMAVPYYLVQHQFSVWFDLPLLLYFGVLLLLLPFLFLRDVPWVFSIPVLIGLFVAAGAFLAILSPTYFQNIITGQGYFVKNLIYSTVAEAQAPSIDQLIIGYGVVTFFLTFVGLALFLYLLVHHRFKRYLVVFLVYGVLSIYLPVSAAKFFLVGSPIFALLPAEAIVRSLDIAGFPELRRTVASLSDRRSQFGAFRKAFKVRHVVILFLVVGLVLPNVWVAIDAGIPGNTKGQFSSQVAATLPPWLQSNIGSPSTQYFGAAGSSLDTPNQYDSAGYNWLAQQDTNLAPSQRPALVSWWDYGFQTIAQGGHPSVADNFQNGIDPAGQFLLAQNESLAIGVLTTTLLQAEQLHTGLRYLPAGLNQILAGDGLNLTELHSLMVNTSADYTLVVAHPERYLPVDPATLTDANAMYLAMEYFIASSLPLSGVAKVYNDVQQYTGWSIRYAMSDSRLFPLSGQSTGIFYAPADLTGRIINSAGLPVTFFNVTVATTQGTFPAGQVPAGASVLANGYQINWFSPFYNSMIYHIYVGYNGTDAGLGPGIPGLAGSQQVATSPLMPGWMLQHFRVVYKTAYYCSQANATPGASCYGAQNLPIANALKAKNGGSVDASSQTYYTAGSEAILEYYPGQTLLGRVVLPDGSPVAAARVTVDDGWGIPHMTTLTASDGSFSLVLPPGNDTLNITIGSFDGLRQQGNIVLKSVPIYVPDSIGLSYNAPALSETYTLAPGTVQGFVYWNANNSSAYAPAHDPLVTGAEVLLWGSNGTAYRAVRTDSSGSFLLSNVPPGVYNYNILYGGRNYSETAVTLNVGATYNATVGLDPGRFVGTVTDLSGNPVAGASVTLANASGTLAVATSNATGVYSIATVGAGNYTLTASGPEPGWRSEGVTVATSVPGAIVRTNLTVGPTVPVSVTVTAQGAPAVGIPVRFVPLAEFRSGASPLGALLNASAGGRVYSTDASGGVLANLPAGTYSVYALGFVGPSLYAGTATVEVGGAGTSSLSISLAPAERLSGTVSGGSGSSGGRIAVTAYAASGAAVTTWASPNGSYALLLPPGRYSVLALSGPTTGSVTVLSALAATNLSGPTVLPLVPVSAISSEFTVSAHLPSGVLFPASGASVRVSVGTSGPSVPAIADGNGTVGFYVPSTLPGGGTYCIVASAIGFAGGTTCNVAPNGLATLTDLPVSLQNVSVTLTVRGLPAGVKVTVNLTAESPTAVNRTYSGGPAFAFSLPPGVYGVGARATVGGGVVYLPSTTLSTTIPVGATYSNLTLYVLPQVTAKGTISLPPGVRLGAVNVTLTSPLLNLTVNGTAYTQGFYATPATYSVYANATANGTTYVALSQLSIATNGSLSGPLVLSNAGVQVAGSLTDPSGGAVPLNATATIRSPSGSETEVAVAQGHFSVALPPNEAYTVLINGTTLTPGPNGSFYQTWNSQSGAGCTPTASNASCRVTVVPTTERVWLNGTLTMPGVFGNPAGTVSLIGPYPSTNVTVVPAPNGSFRVLVLPGAYDVYATTGATGGSGATFASALALPSHSGALTLTLLPTWTATIVLSPPNGTSAGLGPASLIVRDAFGHRLVISGLSGTSTVTLALPAGNYSLSATALGVYGGIATPADASTALRVMNGNVGATLALTYRLVPAVSGSLVGARSATVTAGGTATFSFSVVNTGNLPVTVRPVGSPAYWTFDFAAPSLTLAPGQSASSEVVVQVPAGTAVDHPPVGISFQLANGTSIGSVSPPPIVNVVGYYGVRVGSPTSPPEVGPNVSTIPFYVANTGNTYEVVQLTIVDAPRITGLGWSLSMKGPDQKPATSAGLNAGANETYYVVLNATGAIFVPPGSVTVSGAVANSSGAVQSTATLPIPLLSVHPRSSAGSSGITVTGPSIATPPANLPDWLVPLLSFVPAIALALGIVSWRWWKTRRWNRR